MHIYIYICRFLHSTRPPSACVLVALPLSFWHHQFSKLDNARVTKILYQNIMNMEPDTSPRNVRVAPTKPVDNSEGKARRFYRLFRTPNSQRVSLFAQTCF